MRADKLFRQAAAQQFVARKASASDLDRLSVEKYLIEMNFETRTKVADLESKIKQLNKWVSESENIVFFGGAGVSTLSGIPDFRSADGLYNAEYAYPPETVLSHGFFVAHTAEFYRFYREKMLHLKANPNIVHIKLAE